MDLGSIGPLWNFSLDFYSRKERVNVPSLGEEWGEKIRLRKEFITAKITRSNFFINIVRTKPFE
jgi:hypothetical protein